jgi:hypothetical protein
MKLGLGITLNRGAFVDPDRLSLDLQFASDKTLTARKGPTPMFTRYSTATFVGSDGLIQSAAINEARFDHDPVTLESKGLLIEEARTNIFARSAEFDNVYWTKSNLSISADNEISPDGGMNADTITAVSESPSIYRQVACVASTVYTFSFYVKLGTLTAADYKFAVRDDTNGVFIDSNITPNITPVTTEWRRVTYTFTTPVGCILVRPYLIRTGTVVSGSFYLWGAQLEAGAFPTSYIPTTTTAALTRSADVCSITGSDFTGFYNQSEGTLFVDGSGIMSPTFGGNRPFVSISDGTYNNNFNIYKSSGAANLKGELREGGSAQAIFTIGYTQFAQLKAAFAIKLNDCNAAFNGTAGTTDTSATMPTVDRLAFRDATGAAAGQVSGHIAAVRYYKKRLPNEKLQTLTS